MSQNVRNAAGLYGRVMAKVKTKLFATAAVGIVSSLFFVAPPLTGADPSQLLDQAERLANLYNWYDAWSL
jgi:hypothetical protein